LTLNFKNRGFDDILAIFGCKGVNCDEMDGDKPRLPANMNCYRLSRVSWALVQISGCSPSALQCIVLYCTAAAQHFAVTMLLTASTCLFTFKINWERPLQRIQLCPKLTCIVSCHAVEGVESNSKTVSRLRRPQSWQRAKKCSLCISGSKFIRGNGQQ